MDNEKEMKNLVEFNKTLKEQSYQKKAALQRIFEIAEKSVEEPEFKLDKIIEVCRISGVYEER